MISPGLLVALFASGKTVLFARRHAPRTRRPSPNKFRRVAAKSGTIDGDIAPGPYSIQFRDSKCRDELGHRSNEKSNMTNYLYDFVNYM